MPITRIGVRLISGPVLSRLTSVGQPAPLEDRDGGAERGADGEQEAEHADQRHQQRAEHQHQQHERQADDQHQVDRQRLVERLRPRRRSPPWRR